MKLAIESGCFPGLSHKERLDVIKSAGFDSVDFSLFRLSGDNAELLGENYIERAEELRVHLDGLGLSCSQAHAPFDMREGDPISLDCEKYLRLTRAIEVAAILGAPSIVVHAILINDRDRFEEYNRAFYISLLPYAERVGIRIAVENLFYLDADENVTGGVLDDPKAHCDFVRSLGSPYFNICLDLGHSAVTGHNVGDVIRAIDPELLGHLHVHDNDCVHDMHRTPFSGRLDWRDICSALCEIGYAGDMSLELISQMKLYPTATARDAGLAYAEKIGRELIRMCKGRA